MEKRLKKLWDAVRLSVNFWIIQRAVAKAAELRLETNRDIFLNFML